MKYDMKYGALLVKKSGESIYSESWVELHTFEDRGAIEAWVHKHALRNAVFKLIRYEELKYEVVTSVTIQS